MAEPDDRLDARGLMCPEPIRLAAARLRDLPPGTRLLVLATDPAAPIDFEAWCLATGNELDGCEDRDGVWHIRIHRASD